MKKRRDVPKCMPWYEALMYLEDKPYKRNRPYDPHELRNHIETIIRDMIKETNKVFEDHYHLVSCIRDLEIDVMEMLKIGLQRYNYLHNTSYSLEFYNELFRMIYGYDYKVKE